MQNDRFFEADVQPGDKDPIPFSFSSEELSNARCLAILPIRTAEPTRLFAAAIHRSPMYSGVIKSRGPRYCPSIEDKIHRFADKTRHQIFLEPEGLDTVEIYPNGLSTSLPLDVQIEMVRSIEGLGATRTLCGRDMRSNTIISSRRSSTRRSKQSWLQGFIMRDKLTARPAMKRLRPRASSPVLTPYSVCAANEPLVFSRDQAYIGVLIDDLVTKGTDNEPYRMFTSRAEYRLLLREDNADLRLTEIGHQIGLASESAYQRVSNKKQAVGNLIRALESKQLAASSDINAQLESFESAPLRNPTTCAQLLRRPEISLPQLHSLCPDLPSLAVDIEAQAEVQIKYAGYVNRQLEIVERFQKMEHVRLPDDIDYSKISGLSREVCEKLTRIKPRSLGQASRISGITPAAVTLLSFYIKKTKKSA